MNFGERNKERSSAGMDVPVLLMPKYRESKAKAEELIGSGKYGLDESDFWILKNETKNKDKVMYSGLIISHNGCLKINDNLPEEARYDSGAASKPEWDAKGNLIMLYQSDRQGIYEVGEVSQSNCKNNYPYAMVVKRLFDRVVLKTSKVAFAGIYGEDEADEFRRSEDDAERVHDDIKRDEKATVKKDEKPEPKKEPASQKEDQQQATLTKMLQVSETNVAALEMLIDEVKADKGQILNFYDVSNLSEMTLLQWKQCMDLLTRRKGNGKK